MLVVVIVVVVMVMIMVVVVVMIVAVVVVPIVVRVVGVQLFDGRHFRIRGLQKSDGSASNKDAPCASRAIGCRHVVVECRGSRAYLRDED